MTVPAESATTSLRIIKYANDRTTILAEKNLTYQEMRDTLRVQGDGSTHYYHQGPVFVDGPDEKVEQELRWNPGEDTNVMEKDMGAVMGTSVKDLCDIVGGMVAGDTVEIIAADGLKREFAYKNVYSPPSRQGTMVITWYCSDSELSACTGPYPDNGYENGMRLIFFADTSVNPWGAHVFGNYDWHESAEEKDWYFYHGDAGERYPTTTGLSIKYVSEIHIYSSKPALSEYHGRSGVSNLTMAGAAPPEDPNLYGYRGRVLSTKNAILNGTIRVFSDPEVKPVVANNRFREYNISVSIAPGSNLTLARLYLYISRSHDLWSDKGTLPWFHITFDRNPIEEEIVYVDADGDEKRYVAATYAYDILPLIRENGTFPLQVHNLDPERSVFFIDGVVLVSTEENESAPQTRYWISEGCDIVSSIPEKGLFPDECRTVYPFAESINMSTAGEAWLDLITTGLDRENRTEHTVRFNNKSWENLLDYALFPQILRVPVTRFLNETGNNLTIESSIRSRDADYLVNRNAILVLQEGDPTAPVADNGTEGSGVIAGYGNSSGIPEISPADRRLPEYWNHTLPLPAGNNSAETGIIVTSGNTTEIPDTQVSRSGCRLSLDTDPEGALIFMDGSYLGKTTPYAITVETGTSHHFRFELRGYNPADTIVTPVNDSCIRTSLYNPVLTTKGRMPDEPDDPDGTRFGGLYITSRPTGAQIYINGADTGKLTPSVFMGLEPGRYTVKVVRVLADKRINDRSDFNFVDQHVSVVPEVLLPVDINGIGYTPLYDVIADSLTLRGVSFTLNGYPSDTTLPGKIRTGMFNSFITLHENESFISYPVPLFTEEDRYWLFERRYSQNLTVSVDSDPRGAEVFIDGFRTGFATPFTFHNISDGSHRIMVVKPGFLPQQKLIDLPRYSVPLSPTWVDFYLEEYPSGFLYVNSTPTGCRISIDGLSTGEVTPALFRSLSTGRHSIAIYGPNSSRTFPDVTINSLNMVELSEDFTESETDQFGKNKDN